MKSHTAYLGAALGLLLAGGPPAAAESDTPVRAPKPQARVYTNDDLDRIHPYAGQTGGGSTPAAASDAPDAEPIAPRASRAKTRHETRGEEYWRAEAARAEERVRAFEERASALRARIAEQAERARRERQNEIFGRRRGGSASPARGSGLEASLAAVERRILRIREDLEDRARRAGALPGWLR